jgi:hypothetical protein
MQLKRAFETCCLFICKPQEKCKKIEREESTYSTLDVTTKQIQSVVEKEISHLRNPRNVAIDHFELSSFLFSKKKEWIILRKKEKIKMIDIYQSCTPKDHESS